MEPTRAAIAAIHNKMKGELSLLLDKEPELTEDEAQNELTRITAEGVWEALYTLASAVDKLRKK